MRKRLLIILSLILSVFILSCDEEEQKEPETPLTPSMLVIVESNIYDDVKSRLTTYAEDISPGDTTALVMEWSNGTVEDLRDTIKRYYDTYTINGAFLVGDLPVAWYEMEASNNFDSDEEFPCDLFLMDPHADFSDYDSNGKYNSHTALNPKLGVGRVIGSASEINDYLDRVHDYKTNGPLVTESAYLFIDNDWETYYTDPVINVNNAYSNYEICIDLSETIRSEYIAKLTGTGAEYVHQMIHAYPSSLAIYIDASNKEYVTTNDIKSNNFKASFYNMFNCSGARYTEENLGMTNVLGTDYGLAIMGTTKTGGNYWPQDFHTSLGNGYSWGDAFTSWFYGKPGNMDDKWFMGLCLLGDPMLKVSGTTAKSLLELPEINTEMIHDLEQKMKKISRQNNNKGFEEYKASHKHYYR